MFLSKSSRGCLKNLCINTRHVWPHLNAISYGNEKNALSTFSALDPLLTPQGLVWLVYLPSLGFNYAYQIGKKSALFPNFLLDLINFKCSWSLRGHNWVHFAHRLWCNGTLNSNLAILKNLKLISIRVKELFEPILLRKKATCKIGKGNLYLTLIYPVHFEDVPCQSGVNHIYEGKNDYVSRQVIYLCKEECLSFIKKQTEIQIYTFYASYAHEIDVKRWICHRSKRNEIQGGRVN